MLNYLFNWIHSTILKSLGRCEGCGQTSQTLCEDCQKERQLTEQLFSDERHLD